MSDGVHQERRPALVAWGVLIVVAIVVAFACLGSYSTFGSHEVVGVVPAREMLRTGDWVVPRYGEIPRTRKPPLLYWLVASSSWLLGEFSEFTARLHSALAFLAMASLMTFWAFRWYGREAAFGAALVQITSFWAVNWGRHVEIDLVMCWLTTGAMFLIANQPEGESTSRSRLRWLGLLTLIGITWLAKFHYGTAMVLGPVLSGWALQRRWKSFWNLVNPAGVLIVAACAIIWPALLVREIPEAWDRLRFETVGRATGQIGYDPWWFYLPKLLLLSLPWTLHVLIAAKSSWLRAWRQGDERERFLWVWLIVDLVIISLSPNKHVNYLLAIMPITTLFASQTVARGLARIHRGKICVPKRLVHGVVLLGVTGIAAAGLFVSTPSAAIQIGLRIALGFGLITIVTTWWCWHMGRWSAAGWTLLAGALGVFLVVVSQITPELDGRRQTAEFARQIRAECLREQRVCVFVRRGVLPEFHPSIFYLDDPVYQVRTLSELVGEVKRSGRLMALIDRDNVSRLKMLAPFVEQQEIAAMTPTARSREHPLVCVQLSDSRHQTVARAVISTGSINDPSKRR